MKTINKCKKYFIHQSLYYRINYFKVNNIKKYSICYYFTQFQQKKKSQYNDGVIRQLQQINRQRKMINEKEIQRNRELMNIMKINQHNSIKQLSKKNDQFIQKMKFQRIQENKKKRQLVKSSIEKSRSKILDFHQIKKQDLKRQKQQEKNLLEKKVDKMIGQLQKLNYKENDTLSRVEKSNQALKHLRFAVTKLEKMNQTDFLKIKQKIAHSVQQNKDDQNIMSKILTEIIATNSSSLVQRSPKTLYNSKFYSGHISKIA